MAFPEGRINLRDVLVGGKSTDISNFTNNTDDILVK